MCLASNSRVAAACRSPTGEPSAVFTSSHAASNADAKIFVVSASKTLFVGSECIDIKVLLQEFAFNAGEEARFPSAPHRSSCTRKFVNRFARQSDGPRFQRVSSRHRNRDMSERQGSRCWLGRAGSWGQLPSR